MWTISCVIIIYVPADTHIEFLPTLLSKWWWNICYVCLRICAITVEYFLNNMDGHSNDFMTRYYSTVKLSVHISKIQCTMAAHHVF